MTEVLDTVYSVLSNDAALMAMIEGLYHQYGPGGDAARYPYVVYSQIGDAPALTTDNQERERRVTVRFHIVTKHGQYADIYARIDELMKDAGFMRAYSQDFFDDGDFVRISDYRIGVDAE